jgi:hypothetical protein
MSPVPRIWLEADGKQYVANTPELRDMRNQTMPFVFGL